jgi:dTDP-6-deoxy-L-talose 4-dehydrogenase [NAD(P)+]
VVNCVGCQFGDSETMLDVNVHVVAKLVRVLADHPEVLFVQLGSSAEYGVNSVGRSVREYDPPSPITEYGRTKLTATRLVLGAAAQGRVRGIVLRVFSPIGRGTSVRSMPGRAMTQIEAAMESGVDAIDFGPLSDSQDFIDVDDVASAAVSAGLSEYAIGALLNVGRGRAVRSRTLVELLVSISGYPGRVVEEVGRPSRPGRRSWQQADMEATFRRLEWRPRRSLSASVADMWNHRHHGWTT